MEDAEYAKLAAVEDAMWYFQALHRHVDAALGEPPHGNVPLEILDAGCGAGGLIRRLESTRTLWRWTGLDLSPLACELARRRVGEASKIFEGSVEALPFPDASFDAVTSLDVIYHVDDDAAALRNFFRVLRPGGTVLINVPAFAWLWSYHDVATHARRRYAKRELLGKLRDAGFRDAHATYWNTLPFPLVVARRKLLPAPRGGSDVALFPPLVEKGFNFAMGLERAWLRGVGSLPFGSSLFAIARKPSA